ncbi:archaea-specific SMC-related protein [Salinirubrum litoreum]|uniref:Archaea-specific SMC-related protein n=1 Tax=Salinirubrum litoreum TaxID=1126234 RepID=A0ABD5RG34_9EURY|nr:archaea-specific SMC-related protein [Salinirubrum litoreum]
MAEQEVVDRGATLEVQNIGGIDETSVSLDPGVNVLSGRNATNRTSFLQALMAAMGGENASLKGDAEEGSVELSMGEQAYRRRLVRQNGTVSTTGDPYLDDPELAELFAFLLESNEARRAVTTGQNLRDLIMRPVDTEEIKTEISRLESERADIDQQIEAIEQRKRDLPDLETELRGLEDEIEETRTELRETESEIEGLDTDVEAKQTEQERLEGKLDELRDARNELEDVRYDIDTERESITSLKQDRSTLQTELEALPEASEDELATLEDRIHTLRDRRRRLDTEISSLQSTVQFNEEMLDGERSDLQQAIEGDDGGSVTDELLPDDDVVCWTCGSEVERSEIETTLEQLRELREGKLSTKRDLSTELDDLKADKDSLEEQQRKRRQYQEQLSDVEAEIEQRQARLESLRDERETLEERIQTLEAEVEDLESEQFDEILDLHKEANRLEYELGRLENDREGVEAEIETIEEQVEALSELQAERDRVAEQVAELRTRVESLEKKAIEAFNEHMDDVLSALDYGNLDRVWIERVQREVRDGRQKSIETFFELHVVRSTASGTTYEDTVDHLSESEREVTGLVFALAGYLVHDVHEKVPFMLLDSLEAIDADRIAELVEYFEVFPDYLVVALLDEDAQALDAAYNRVESI